MAVRPGPRRVDPIASVPFIREPVGRDYVAVKRLVRHLVAAPDVSVERHQGFARTQFRCGNHPSVARQELVVGRRADHRAIVEFYFKQRIPTDEPGCVEHSDDEASVSADAIAEEQLAGVGPARHFFECWGCAIDQRNARVAAEAARVGAFPQANDEHAARDSKVLDGASERERVRWDDADIGAHIDEALRIERLRVHNRRVDVREDLEFVRAADVVAVARGSVGDDLLAIDRTNLIGRKRLDHAAGSHPSNPVV